MDLILESWQSETQPKGAKSFESGGANRSKLSYPLAETRREHLQSFTATRESVQKCLEVRGGESSTSIYFEGTLDWARNWTFGCPALSNVVVNLCCTERGWGSSVHEWVLADMRDTDETGYNVGIRVRSVETRKYMQQCKRWWHATIIASIGVTHVFTVSTCIFYPTHMLPALLFLYDWLAVSVQFKLSIYNIYYYTEQWSTAGYAGELVENKNAQEGNNYWREHQSWAIGTRV